ncbi:MAG: tetratricopeptide repeat protein [Candidatus Zixiibacteriota bacterium]
MKKPLFIINIFFIVFAVNLGCSSSIVKHDVREVKTDTGHRLTSHVLPQRPFDEHIDYRAYDYYTNGLILEAEGELEQAALNYREALKYFPDSYQIGYSLAEVYYRIYKPQLALNTLETLIPRDADVFRLTAACYRMLNEIPSVKKSYMNLLKLEPDNLDAYTYLADIYRTENNLDSTIWAFKNLVRVNPGDNRLWHQLGRFQAQQKDFEGAKNSFRMSLNLDPSRENFLSYIGLGELYEVTSQGDSAVILYKKGLEIDPTNPLLLKMLVTYYLTRDNYSEALPYSGRLLDLAEENFPEKRRLAYIYYRLDSLEVADSIFTELENEGDVFGLNHFYLGLIKTRLGDIEKARDEFEKLTILEDTLYIGWINLGLAYRNLNEPEKEIETYKEGLNSMKSESGVEELLFSLGSAYERQNRVEEAISTFEMLIDHYPDNAQALNYLGYMLADRNRDLGYAKELITRAIELLPENAAFLDSYGWVSYRQGNFKEALEYLKRAVKLDNDPIIFDHLGDIYKARGKMNEARQWWQKALDLDPDNQTIREKLDL